MKPRQPSRAGRRERVPNPAELRSGRCEPARRRADRGPNQGIEHMKAGSLVCKGCLARYPLEALFACASCFVPLEVAYDGIDDPVSRDAVAAGPQTLWRYRGLPAGRRPPGGAAGRHVAARPGAAAGRSAGPRLPAVRQDRDVQPHPLLQGPGGRDRCRQGPRAWLRGAVLRVHGEPGRRYGRRRRGARPAHLHLRARRSGARKDRRGGGLRQHRLRRRGIVRRRQPALLRAGLRAAVGVRQREHARLLLGGLEDDRARDRRAARLAGARPGGRPDRLGSLYARSCRASARAVRRG